MTSQTTDQMTDQARNRMIDQTSSQMNAGRKNIILIGMPGAGKSTVGVVLAKILNMQFLDTDLLIQQEYGETLQSMIDGLGSEEFINRENRILKDMDACGCVISTGGSAVYSEEGMAHLKDHGKAVYLRGDLSEIAMRINDFDARGIVMRGNVGTFEELYAQRSPLYESMADAIIEIDGKNITEVARDVAKACEDIV